MIINEQQFDDLVADAWKKIPGRFKNEIENVSIVIESVPGPQQLSRINTNCVLLGLFEGVPKVASGQAVLGVQPSKITLFRDNIIQDAKDEKDLKNKITEVLMHEIGHYFGYNEAALYVMDKKLRNRMEKK
jgi:predicted Zn-dependent protease with MMP-like domain